jgi:hypothetical protein
MVWTCINYTWKITDGLSQKVARRKKKARNKVGKGSGKSDEAEEFNT